MTLLIGEDANGGGISPDDADGDGIADSSDNCPTVANAAQIDSDGDDFGDLCDSCPNDPNKAEPGACGCGFAELDSDGDGAPDCIDFCPDDADKTEPGMCGCGVVESTGDSDGDGVIDCLDPSPNGVDCEALTADGCQLPAPENVSSAFESVSGNDYVRIAWSEVECAQSYWLRIGTQSNLTELDYGDLSFIEVEVNSKSYWYGTTNLSAGTYYFAVLPSCGQGANAERGSQWSTVASFDWPQP
jgi:hypothetical protein